MDKKKRMLLAEVERLTSEPEWMEDEKTAAIVEKYGKVLFGESCRKIKIKVIFPDEPKDREEIYETLADMRRATSIGTATAREHMKSGKPDKFGRRYERVYTSEEFLNVG